MQIVVTSKFHHKCPSLRVSLLQLMTNGDAFNITDACWHTPGRIGEVCAALNASVAGAELAHDTSETFGPIARAELLPGIGDALNERVGDFRACHRQQELMQRLGSGLSTIATKLNPNYMK